jgi:hypothetical protein
VRARGGGRDIGEEMRARGWGGRVGERVEPGDGISTAPHPWRATLRDGQQRGLVSQGIMCSSGAFCGGKCRGICSRLFLLPLWLSEALA